MGHAYELRRSALVNVGILNYLSFYLHVIFIGSSALMLGFSKRPLSIFGFAIIYLLLHCFKGSGHFIITRPFYIYMLYIMAFSFTFKSDKRMGK